MVSRAHIARRLASEAELSSKRVRNAEGARLRGDHDFDATMIEADMGNRRAAAVLVPRPETEGLVVRVLDLCRAAATPRIVDVGTGSGAIVVTLAKHLPRATFAATDVSAAALEVARANAVRHGVADRITFLHGDLLADEIGRAHV